MSHPSFIKAARTGKILLELEEVKAIEQEEVDDEDDDDEAQ